MAPPAGQRKRPARPDPKQLELERLGEWRVEQFERMLEGRVGPRICKRMAKQLAQSDADIRACEKMLGEGCPPQTLLEIVL